MYDFKTWLEAHDFGNAFQHPEESGHHADWAEDKFTKQSFQDWWNAWRRTPYALAQQILDNDEREEIFDTFFPMPPQPAWQQQFDWYNRTNPTEYIFWQFTQTLGRGTRPAADFPEITSTIIHDILEAIQGSHIPIRSSATASAVAELINYLKQTLPQLNRVLTNWNTLVADQYAKGSATRKANKAKRSTNQP